MEYSEVLWTYDTGKRLRQNSGVIGFSNESKLMEIDDKTEIIKHIISLDFRKMEDQELNEVLEDAFVNFDISIEDMIEVLTEWLRCPKCDGTGVIVSNDIDICDSCGGPGLIKNYMLDVTPVTYEIDGRYRKLMTNKNLLVKNEYVDFTSVFVYFEVETGIIEYAGKIQDIYTSLELPGMYYIDIFLFSDGKYRVMKLDQYNENYVSLPKYRHTKLMTNILSSSVNMYMDNASYDCDDLVAKYLNKYDTIPKVIENIKSHIDKFENTDYNIPKKTMSILSKIKTEFVDIGINLDWQQAMTVYDRISVLVGDDTEKILLSFNSIGVFIIEYIIISAEYDTLSDYIIKED